MAATFMTKAVSWEPLQNSSLVEKKDRLLHVNDCWSPQDDDMLLEYVERQVFSESYSCIASSTCM